MKALVYTSPLESRVMDVDAAVARAGESVVDLAFCGICGSDMHAWHGHDDRRVPPLVLGHEAVGTVATGEMQGQRVAINPLMTCGQCPACVSGATHLCPEREMIGMKRPGGFAEQVAIRTSNLFAIPDHLKFEDAALAEPLACCVHAIRLLTADYTRAHDRRMVVLGGGAIGLLSAMVAVAAGYTDVWIAETNPMRREMLESCVNAKSYDPLETSPDDKPIHYVLDAVGTGITRKSSTALIAPGGFIVHIGLQDNEPGLDTRYLTLQEVTFMGTYCYTDADFAEALSLLAEGTISGEGFTEIRPLDDGASGFLDIHHGKAPPKIILDTTT
ncbi:MAG: alcohol dehydrogenase catalytic domain-containing protein [Alphaproteobacteria bacterium]|nr:alcohol dehydrogenase catalytic domain-containing protein [Alphaproteobacteria bacterium]